MSKLTQVVLAACILLGTAVSFAAPSAKMNSKLQWQAEITMNLNQVKYQQDNDNAFASTIKKAQAKGANIGVRDGNIILSGTQDIDNLRNILFDGSNIDSINFLGGPVTMTVNLADSADFTLKLQALMTAGYTWSVDSENSDYSQDGDAVYENHNRGIGTPTTQVIKIKHSKSSTSNVVKLKYQRPFDKTEPVRTKLELWVPRGLRTLELTDPKPVKSIKSKSSQNVKDDAPPITLPALKSFPAAYDSRSSGIVPAVRNQGSCGSCWAFGTVGVMEIAVAKSGNSMADLSEQFLVSCNRDNWSCNGGLTASKYHYNTLGLSQTGLGAVLESSKPYTATNGSCSIAYPHSHVASSWQFITGSEWTMPTNDQIKAAIMTYGAVTAGVCAGVSGFLNYTGGVYNPTSNGCGGSTDHQIVLVGWNDATQSWILRNSWGSSWGESGYMRIHYDPSGTSSRVGEGASWIAVAGNANNSPDLMITSITSAANVPLGGSTTVTAVVKNQGSVSAAASRIGFYLSTDSMLTQTDITIGSACDVPALGAGQTFTCSDVAVNIPATVTTGEYYMGAYADDTSVVAESNENNNGLAASNAIMVGTIVDTQLTSGVTIDNQSVSLNGWKYYYIDVPEGATNLTLVTTNATSDVDIYTQVGAKPTLNSSVCSPYLSSGNESCSQANPTAGRWWLGVYGYEAGSFSVTGTIVTSPTADTQLTNGVTINWESVALDGWKYYYIDVPEGATNLTLVTTNATGDVDIYTQVGSKPTLDSYVCSPYLSSGNESCSQANPTAGRWWLGVHGYEASSYSVTAIAAISTSDVNLTSGVTVNNESVLYSSWRYYYIDVPAGAESLILTTTNATGDVDIYTQVGAKPTLNSYVCSPYLSSGNESCTQANPTAGRWWLGVRGYEAGNYSVTGTIVMASVDTELVDDVAINGESVAYNSWRYYYIDIPAGATSLTLSSTNATGDVDIYTQVGSKPTLDSYVCRPYLSSGNEACSQANPTTGRWWLGVHGYEGGSYSVTGDIGSRVDQTIGPIIFSPNLLAVGGTTTINATASSGLPVTFNSITSSICSVNNNTVAGISVGSCGIVATQNGNANYNPAQIQTGYIAVTSATNYTVTPRVNGRGGSISPNSVQTVARGSA
ncbi:hypothetical protein TI04_08855, partial [Achromatium sp. WMS2]